MPDIMHDILEGCLELCLRHLLVHCTSTNVFTLCQLNERIRTFEYGVESTNKPSELNVLSKDKALKQSGIIIGKHSQYFTD